MKSSTTIQQIDGLKKEADTLQPVNPDFEQKFWNKYRLEFNYNSNHIEGNTLTYGHTELLLMFDKVGSDNYSLRELEEMKAHDVALRLVIEAALDPEHVLSEKFIREINQIILVRPFYKEAETNDGQSTKRLIEPGKYKTQPNHVRLENGEVFNYASVEETPAQMGDLIEWIRKEENTNELHPVQLATLVHYRFVRIHPFDDSNGRTSRLLLNYYLMRKGYAPIVIESSDKKNYLTALNRADTGDLESLIQYVAACSNRWQKIYLSAVKGEDIEEKNDYKKKIELLKKQLKSTDDRIEQTLNAKSFNIAIEKTISPLLFAIVSELNSFDEFYIDSNIRMEFKDTLTSKGNSKIWDIDPKDHDSLKGAFEDIKSGFMNLPPIHLDFIYQHKHIRKATNLNDSYQTHFAIDFDKYKISIASAPKEKTWAIPLLYHDFLSESSINEISSTCAKNELEFIEQKLLHVK